MITYYIRYKVFGVTVVSYIKYEPCKKLGNWFKVLFSLLPLFPMGES